MPISSSQTPTSLNIPTITDPEKARAILNSPDWETVSVKPAAPSEKDKTDTPASGEDVTHNIPTITNPEKAKEILNSPDWETISPDELKPPPGGGPSYAESPALRQAPAPQLNLLERAANAIKAKLQPSQEQESGQQAINQQGINKKDQSAPQLKQTGWVTKAAKDLYAGALETAKGFNAAIGLGAFSPTRKYFIENPQKTIETIAKENKSKSWLGRETHSFIKGIGSLALQLPAASTVGMATKLITAGTALAGYLADLPNFVIGSGAMEAAQGYAKKPGIKNIPHAITKGVEGALFARLYTGKPVSELTKKAIEKRLARGFINSASRQLGKFTAIGVGQTAYEAAKQGRAPTPDELSNSFTQSLAMALAFTALPVIEKVTQAPRDKFAVAKLNKQMETALREKDIDKAHKALAGFLDNQKVSLTAKKAVVGAMQPASGKSAEESAMVFEKQRADEERLRQSPKGAKLLHNQLKAEQEKQEYGLIENQPSTIPQPKVQPSKIVEAQPVPSVKLTATGKLKSRLYGKQGRFIQKETSQQGQGENVPQAKLQKLSGDITKVNGDPFALERTAKGMLKLKGLQDTHEPVQVEGGWVLRPKEANHAINQQAPGEFHANVTEPQVQEVSGKEGEGMPSSEGVPGMGSSRQSTGEVIKNESTVKQQPSLPKDIAKQITDLTKKIKKQNAKLEKLHYATTTRAQATTREAASGKAAMLRDNYQTGLSKLIRQAQKDGFAIPNEALETAGSGVDYNEKGEYEPIKTPETEVVPQQATASNVGKQPQIMAKKPGLEGPITGNGKQPWEMTKEEWVKTQGKRVSGQSVAKTEKLARLLHKDHIKIWLKEGKPVPRNVLEEYKGKPWADEALKTQGGSPSGGDTEIKDFGEKLGGARKDIAKFTTKEIPDSDIASFPLSKIWPKKEVESIQDVPTAALAESIRAEIPPKPRTKYKLARWVNRVKTVREFMKIVNDRGVDYVLGKMDDNPLLKKVSEKARLLQGLPRKHWSRVGKVENVPNAYRYEKEKRVKSPYVYAYIDGKHVSGSNIDEVKAKALEMLSENKKQPKMQFEIRGKGDKWAINKKGDPLYRKLKTFTTSKEALEFRRHNYSKLVKAWNDLKEQQNIKETDVRGSKNAPRKGKDYRNGKDITPKMFSDSFGFRGVEFGKWVSQGKNVKERQGMLNAAYDAFSDLAHILNIPKKAISLNGELGLGFGSRGHGWASAHFEPDKIVINLTKPRGAGSLAHEWFHALDNYFQRATGHNKTEFFTKTGGANGDSVRPEVKEAFKALVKTLNKSSMAKRSALIAKGQPGSYWNRVIERAARSFENYIITKMEKNGISNDYLANVTSLKDFARDSKRYPYLTEKEIPPVEAAFDALFHTLKTKETPKGIALYSVTKTKPKQGLNKDAVKLLLRSYGKKYSNAPKITVIQHQTDHPIAAKKDAVVKGMFIEYPKGRHEIVLVADNLSSAKDIAATTLEEIFHSGLRSGLRELKMGDVEDMLNAALDSTYKTHKDDIDALITKQPAYKHIDLATPEGRREATDEWIAKGMVKDSLPKRVWDKIAFVFKSIARKLGFKVNLGLSDIKVIARKAVMEKMQNGKVGKFAISVNAPNIRYQTEAWHGQTIPGRPIKKFSADMVGSGAGNALGWGVYISEEKGVGKVYAEIGAKKTTYGIDQNALKNIVKDTGARQYIERNLLRHSRFEKRKQKKRIVDDLADTKSSFIVELQVIRQAKEKGQTDKEFTKDLKDRLADSEGLPVISPDKLEKAIRGLTRKDIDKIITTKNRRNLYQVTLGKDLDKMDWLRWDKPVPTKQLNKIYNLMRAEGVSEDAIKEWKGEWEGKAKGKDVYKSLVGNNLVLNKTGYPLSKGERAVSEFLNRAGIDGVKAPIGYFGGASVESKGKFNYVVFDPEKVQIKEHIRYSLAGEKAKEPSPSTIKDKMKAIKSIKEVQDALDKAKGAMQRIKMNLAPAHGGKQAEDVALKFRESFGDTYSHLVKVEGQFDSIRNYIDRTPPKIIKDAKYKYETGNADTIKDPVLKKYFKEIHTPLMEASLDLINATKRSLGKDEIEGLTNYLAHLYKNNKHASKVLHDIISGEKPLAGSSFTKQRVIPTEREAEKLGLKPRFLNPVDTDVYHYNAVLRWAHQMQDYKMLKDEGFIKFFRVGKKGNELKAKHPDWVRLKDPSFTALFPTEKGVVVAGAYYAPPDVAKVLNNLSSSSLEEIIPGFRLFRKTGNLINMTNLGISTFHGVSSAVTNGMNYLALGLSDLSSGHWRKAGAEFAKAALYPAFTAKDIHSGLKAIKSVRAGTPKDPFVVEYMRHGGKIGLDPIYEVMRIRPERVLKQALAQKGVKGYTKAVTTLPLAVIDKLAAPIMRAQVPALKVNGFKLLMQAEMRHLDVSEPFEDFVKTKEGKRVCQKMVDRVEDRFGQLNYDNLFWHKWTKDALMSTVRSVGWNLGDIREVAGGGIDLTKAVSKLASGDIKGAHAALTQRVFFMAAMPILTAWTGSVLYYLMNGKAPKTWKNMTYPSTPDGTRLSIPGYYRDYAALYYQGLPVTIEHKLHPILNIIGDWVTGTDYWGNYTSDIHDPWYIRYKDKAEHAAEQIMPFSVQAYLNSEGVAKYTAITGLAKAPNYITLTPIQKEIFAEFRRIHSGGMTKEQVKRAKIKRELRAEITGKERAKPEDFKKAVKEGVFGVYPPQINANWKRFRRTAKLDSDIRAFMGLPTDTQVYLLNKMSKEEFKKYFRFAHVSAKFQLAREKRRQMLKQRRH